MSNSPSQTTENEPCETLHPSDFTSLNGLSQLLKAYLKILSKIISGQCGDGSVGKALAEQRQGPEFNSPQRTYSCTQCGSIIQTVTEETEESPEFCVPPMNKRSAFTVGDERHHSRLTSDLHTSATGMHTIYTHSTHTQIQTRRKRKKEGRKENASGI